MHLKLYIYILLIAAIFFMGLSIYLLIDDRSIPSIASMILGLLLLGSGLSVLREGLRRGSL